MAIHSYFFQYDLKTKSFKFCAEAHEVEDVTAVRSEQNPKELYVERSFAMPQENIESISQEVNHKFQDNIYFRCKDCGKVVYLTPDEEWWFKSKGFNIPKRCHRCRNNRRVTKESSD
jgi:hypothetical protein